MEQLLSGRLQRRQQQRQQKSRAAEQTQKHLQILSRCALACVSSIVAVTVPALGPVVSGFAPNHGCEVEELHRQASGSIHLARLV
jgi:ABC-type Fe3+ transport system permease subunit